MGASVRPFSLVATGPLHRMLLRLSLSGGQLQGLGRRVLWAVLLAWLPLLVLSYIDGRAWDGCEVPFLKDVDAHTRFLLGLPLLFAAEVLVQLRLGPSFAKFMDRRLVEEGEQKRFQSILDSTQAWLDSRWPEILLIALVYSVGIGGLWHPAVGSELSAWYGVRREGVMDATLAGHWLNLVSTPMFQFLLLRWYYRLLVWWGLMWRLSRLNLRLQPLHPDHAGGLGFLAQLSQAFGPLLAAQGVLSAGWIADQIFFGGAHLLDFKLELATVTVVTVFFILGPLLMFTPALANARRRGLSDYGNLAMRYAREFDQKWLGQRIWPADPVLGTGDIQSLADLGNSYATLKQMRFVVFSTQSIIGLVAALLAPVAPLVLTMFSAEELLTRALKILL